MTSITPGPLVAAAEEARADAAALLDRVLQQIATALPELAADPRIRGVLVATVRDTVGAALRVFGTGSPPSGAGAPASGLELARLLAQQNVPISVMLRAYRLGQAAFQQELIGRIAARRPSAEEVARAARDLSSVTFSFIDAISEEVVAAYQSERDDWVRQRNTARLARVTALLAGRAGDTDEVERTLGYELGPRHVGAVLWCGPGVDEHARPARLERRARETAAALGCARPPLVVAPDASTLWVWFPAAEEPGDAVAAVLEGTGEHVAFGDPARGPAGFRRTHQQARQGHAVAAAATPGEVPRVVTPALLGPLTLLAVDPAGVGPWVRSVLGGLAADDEPHARLRETLWEYLSAGGSLAAAAEALHLHRNTVQYRIRRAEQARGRPLSQGRLDVEVALLAWRVLGPAVLLPEGGTGGSRAAG